MPGYKSLEIPWADLYGCIFLSIFFSRPFFLLIICSPSYFSLYLV